ncbi:TRADD-N-associated membrane domain-containing protein [Empedobacter falsenii]
MYKNVAELREYYVINKQQARNSYSASLFMCFLGFILFSSGVAYSVYDPSNNIIQYSTFGGVIIELIAGLFFWLYSKSIKQINLFHSSLQNTEKFLTAIQLVEKISEDKRDETYSNIINKIIERDIDK